MECCSGLGIGEPYRALIASLVRRLAEKRLICPRLAAVISWRCSIGSRPLVTLGLVMATRLFAPNAVLAHGEVQEQIADH